MPRFTAELLVIMYQCGNPWNRGGSLIDTALPFTLNICKQVGMELHISKVHSDDFGNYKCIAKNPRGQTDGDITLTGNLTTCYTTLTDT